MEQKEIIEGNKLLAEFCGLETVDENWFKSDTKFMGFATHDITDLKFHSDWNWIHEAWDKFRDLAFEDKLSYNAEQLSYHQVTIASNIFENTPPETFQSLIEAVQWYNTTKETTKEI